MFTASHAGTLSYARSEAGPAAGEPALPAWRTPRLKTLIPLDEAGLAVTSYDGRWRILKMLRQRRDALAAQRRAGLPHYDDAAFQDICRAINAEREALEAAFPEGLA